MGDALYLIVEGDGEATAAPALVRRILQEHLQYTQLQVRKAYNAQGRGNLTTPKGLERFLQLTRYQVDCAGVMVLLDAEEEALPCPPELALDLAQRAMRLNLPFPVAIVCATCEYESWFLFNLHTIVPKYLIAGATYAGDPERECSAKGWLSRHMPGQRRYKETQDQEKMTFDIDIDWTLDQSRSFRRLVHAVQQLIDAIENQRTDATPVSYDT